MEFDLKRALLGQADGKALAPHPALQDGAPIATYSPGASREDAKISQREATRHLDAYGGTQAIDWLTDCLNLYGDTVSTAAWHLERDGNKLVRRKTDKTPKGVEQAPADLVRLLDEPNPFMDYIELVELLIIDLMLVGNAYWFKWRVTEEGKPLALYRLAPPYVKIIPGPFGPKRYEYQPPGAKKPLKIDPTELMHFRRPNPHSQYYGMGIVQGGGRPFDLELSLTDTQASYFENKADPSLIVQSERRIPRDVFNKLRAQLRQRTAGSNRAGELLVLEAGLKASSLSTSAREAMFAELSKMSRDRIYAKFRASPKLFGITDESSGADKTQDARREFDTKVMRPFMDKLQTRVTRGLTAAWGLDYVIDYEYVMPPEELVKLAGDFGSVPGVKVREVRGFLVRGRMLDEESTGDEDIDETVLNLPGENLDENGQPIDGVAGFADKNLPREAGRPPKAENTRAFPSTGKRFPAGSAARRSTKALSIEQVSERLQVILDQKRIEDADQKAVTFEPADRATVGNKLPDEKRPSDTLAADRVRDVDAAVAYIEHGLKDAVYTLERGLLDTVEGKAFNSSDLKQRVSRSKAWKSFTAMIAKVIEEGVRRAISAAAIHQGSAGRIPENDLDYDAIAKRIVHRPDGVEGITKTFKASLVDKVAAARDAGKDKGDIDNLIRESIKEWRDGKAGVVALTEATHGYNEGTLTIAEELGVDVVVEDGHDHDEPCKEADGQVWTVDHARENRLEHPNCRRAFTPLLDAA